MLGSIWSRGTTSRQRTRRIFFYSSQTIRARALPALLLIICRIKQWKTQFKKWNLKKRTEGDEYKAILKKKRKREKERPGVASEFFLRDKVVPPGKIARYEEESRKRGTINATDTLSDIRKLP